jgi:hypothetical protein
MGSNAFTACTVKEQLACVPRTDLGKGRSPKLPKPWIIPFEQAIGTEAHITLTNRYPAGYAPEKPQLPPTGASQDATVFQQEHL